jgi:hypothetical protein
MHRVFGRYFICEDGHITVSNDKKTKCDAKEWQLEYVKGKRKKEWRAEKREAGICGKKIVEEKDIPEFLDLGKVWDPDVMYAFLVGQRLDSSFVISLQEQISKIWEKINAR